MMRSYTSRVQPLGLLTAALLVVSCSSESFDPSPPGSGGVGSGGSAIGGGPGSGGTAGVAGQGGVGGTGGAECPSACSDGDPCNGLETCEGDSCKNGQPLADGAACGKGIVCIAAACALSECGDGVVDSRTEFCDSSPGCTDECKYEPAIAAGGRHTCALLESGSVRCWGRNKHGQLGYGHRTNVGDGIGPSIIEAGDVPIGGQAIALAAGSEHTCALLDTGAVRCWGQGAHGRLGKQSWDSVGDGEGLSISAAGDAQTLIGKATAIAAGGEHTCALLENGDVQCFGRGHFGALGYDRKTEESDGPVPLGSKARAITAGDRHTCALTTTGGVRCWGQFGHGSEAVPVALVVGDGEGPSIIDVGDLPLGAAAVAVSAGGRHACAVLEGGAVRCWGWNDQGQLGHDSADWPAGGVDVILDAKATTLAGGGRHTCALLEGGNMRCWGNGWVLGYEQRVNVSDGVGPTISQAGDVVSVSDVLSTSTGALHTCAMRADGGIRCWGAGNSGQLGNDSQLDLGDEPGEMSMPDIKIE